MRLIRYALLNTTVLLQASEELEQIPMETAELLLNKPAGKRMMRSKQMDKATNVKNKPIFLKTQATRSVMKRKAVMVGNNPNKANWFRLEILQGRTMTISAAAITTACGVYAAYSMLKDTKVDRATITNHDIDKSLSVGKEIASQASGTKRSSPVRRASYTLDEAGNNSAYFDWFDNTNEIDENNVVLPALIYTGMTHTARSILKAQSDTEIIRLHGTRVKFGDNITQNKNATQSAAQVRLFNSVIDMNADAGNLAQSASQVPFVNNVRDISDTAVIMRNQLMQILPQGYSNQHQHATALMTQNSMRDILLSNQVHMLGALSGQMLDTICRNSMSALSMMNGVEQAASVIMVPASIYIEFINKNPGESVYKDFLRMIKTLSANTIRQTRQLTVLDIEEYQERRQMLMDIATDAHMIYGANVSLEQIEQFCSMLSDKCTTKELLLLKYIEKHAATKNMQEMLEDVNSTNAIAGQNTMLLTLSNALDLSENNQTNSGNGGHLGRLHRQSDELAAQRLAGNDIDNDTMISSLTFGMQQYDANELLSNQRHVDLRVLSLCAQYILASKNVDNTFIAYRENAAIAEAEKLQQLLGASQDSSTQVATLDHTDESIDLQKQYKMIEVLAKDNPEQFRTLLLSLRDKIAMHDTAVQVMTQDEYGQIATKQADHATAISIVFTTENAEQSEEMKMHIQNANNALNGQKEGQSTQNSGTQSDTVILRETTATGTSDISMQAYIQETEHFIDEKKAELSRRQILVASVVERSMAEEAALAKARQMFQELAKARQMFNARKHQFPQAAKPSTYRAEQAQSQQKANLELLFKIIAQNDEYDIEIKMPADLKEHIQNAAVQMAHHLKNFITGKECLDALLTAYLMLSRKENVCNILKKNNIQDISAFLNLMKRKSNANGRGNIFLINNTESINALSTLKSTVFFSATGLLYTKKPLLRNQQISQHDVILQTAQGESPWTEDIYTMRWDQLFSKISQVDRSHFTDSYNMYEALSTLCADHILDNTMNEHSVYYALILKTALILADRAMSKHSYDTLDKKQLRFRKYNNKYYFGHVEVSQNAFCLLSEGKLGL